MVSSVSWDNIPSDTIASLVRLATNAGAAVILGRTSDQGALSVYVLDGKYKVREYPHSEAAVDELVAWLRDEYFVPDGQVMKQDSF